MNFAIQSDIAVYSLSGTFTILKELSAMTFTVLYTLGGSSPYRLPCTVHFFSYNYSESTRYCTIKYNQLSNSF